MEYVEARLPVLFSNIGLGMESKTVDQRSRLLCCSKRCKIIIAQATKKRPYIYQNDICQNDNEQNDNKQNDIQPKDWRISRTTLIRRTLSAWH